MKFFDFIFKGLGFEEKENPKVQDNVQDNNIDNVPAERINEYQIKSNADLKTVVQLLRNKKKVVVLLYGLSPNNKNKIIDFLSGACYALKCDIKKIDEDKYELNA